MQNILINRSHFSKTVCSLKRCDKEQFNSNWIDCGQMLFQGQIHLLAKTSTEIKL